MSKEYEMQIDKDLKKDDFLGVEEEIEIDFIQPKKTVSKLISVDVLDKIKTEIEEKYGGYDICEWFEDYDYEENNISEYQLVGTVSDILTIIDKYRTKSEVLE